MSDVKTYGYFVDNGWHTPADGGYFESENPGVAEHCLGQILQ